MYSLNGVRNGVGRDAPVINGGKYARINGNAPYEYNKWRMVWNGNHFAPPEAGAVLWFPGVPGAGTTIQDFSTNYTDSTINTNEALDATETGVDCSADATTAIPVNSIIWLSDGTGEKMLVTATGTTLTVVRGYQGTTAATHLTGLDIWRWLPNNGTISGATWTRLPSGLWYPDFDGADDVVTIAAAASINNLAALSASAWIKPDTVGEGDYGRIFDKATNSASLNGWLFSVGTNNVLAFQVDYNTTDLLRFSANNSITLGVWQRVTVTWTGSATATSIKFYVNDVETSYGTTTNGVDTRSDDSGSTLRVGNDALGARTFDGGIALPLAQNSVVVPSRYSQERHLFGV